MPYFMDRHDLAGETAADLAAAHLSDVSVQERHGVRFLSYWFDYHRHSAFCLVEAPDPEAARAVHREAHGGLPTEIIPVDPAEAARFLGRIDDPLATGRAPDPALRTIMFTDIAGSTDLCQLHGDEAAVHLVRRHDGIVREALGAHGGREVKHTGDGMMASFPSVRDALHAALRIQAASAAPPPDGSPPLRLRIGMSAGEPVEDGNDLFGSAVQLAARLCALAEPGEVMVASVVRDLAAGKRFRFGPLVAATLKGFPEPVPACPLLGAAEG
jgi:class 3 adenylate cyclase